MTLPMAVLIFAIHILLTLLPIVAAVLIATAFGISDRLLLLSIGLCGLLVTSYLTFWIFWANAAAGRTFAIALAPALVIVVVWLGVSRRGLLKELGFAYLPPTLLWIASSLMIFSFGAVYTSSQALTTTAEARFVASGLPIDNEVPLIVAHALQSPHRPIPHPLFGVWHLSDRPPLQAGVYLSQEALLPGSDSQAVHYEVVGILLQGLWIFGVWGLLAAVRARTRLVALVATAILFSGFTLVNTFYTWPKLFAAAYLALLAAMLFTPSFKRLRGSGIAGATAGALAGAALLGHEGSGLALLAFIIVMAVQRKMPSKKFILAAIAILVITQGSWMAYQKVIDPPGDYLARLQIADQVHLPGEPGSLQAVTIDKYEKTPFGVIVSDKIANIEKPFEGVPYYFTDTVHLIKSYFMTGKAASTARKSAADDLIRINFFNLVPSIGFLALGFFAWLIAAGRNRRRRPTPVMRLAGTIWIFLVANIVTWSLIMFGPGFTVIHQGTYVTELLMYTACVIGLWELSRRLCTALVLVQASFTVLVYGSNGQPNLPSNVGHHFNSQMLTLSIIGLVLTVVALSLVATGRWQDRDDNLPDGREWRMDKSDHDLMDLGDGQVTALVGE